MVMFELLWFVLFYIYNHDVTLTLYINWAVFLHKYYWLYLLAAYTSLYIDSGMTSSATMTSDVARETMK